jgi:hypothetical protein
MRAVAERFLLTCSAAAQAKGGASAEAEGFAVGIIEFNVAFDFKRAVFIDGDFGWHDGVGFEFKESNRRYNIARDESIKMAALSFQRSHCKNKINFFHKSVFVIPAKAGILYFSSKSRLLPSQE